MDAIVADTSTVQEKPKGFVFEAACIFCITGDRIKFPFIVFEILYEARSKGFKPHLERRAISEHFCDDNYTSYKTRKSNAVFRLNFYASEVHKR